MTDHTPITGFSAAQLPTLPAIMKAGNYHPAELMDYFTAADQAGMGNHHTAQHLRVSVDRIVYFRGSVGGRLMERRARLVLGMLSE